MPSLSALEGYANDTDSALFACCARILVRPSEGIDHVARHAGLAYGMIDAINAARPAFVVHVGDITDGQGPCDDAWLLARKRQFERFRAPFVLLPGDNEWTDCHRGGFEPRERLGRWRQLFCFPLPALALERQKGAHCENVRWHAPGLAFVGLNVPGGGSPELGDVRMAATLEWLDESLAWAESRRARTIFVFMHADPRFERVGTTDAYARLRAVLRTHAAWYADRLVLVHGDLHTYRDDNPLPGLRRIEVWGSPIVSWLRIDAGGAYPRVDADW